MRLLASVSGHGRGHLAQSALVIEALRRQHPGLSLTIWSALSRVSVAQRIAEPFAYRHDPDDFGLHMQDSMRIRLSESAAHYEILHRHLDAALDERARNAVSDGADVVLANVSYLAIAAAARAGIPAVAMCSLNWADVWAHFFSARAGAGRIHDEMLDAYNQADTFLLPEPSMPMREIRVTRPIGPLARTGRRVRDLISGAAGIRGRFGLITLQGADRLPVETWPLDEMGWHWLVPAAWRVRHARVRDIETVLAAAGAGFAELVASADVLIAKPGYGTFVEAACNGARVVYVRRPDWPEQEFLIPWLRRHAPAVEVSAATLCSGPGRGLLEELASLPRGDAVEPSGIGEAAGLLAGYGS